MWHAAPAAMTLLPSSPKGYVSPKDEAGGESWESTAPQLCHSWNRWNPTFMGQLAWESHIGQEFHFF
jgi:hypothetical protein